MVILYHTLLKANASWWLQHSAELLWSHFSSWLLHPFSSWIRMKWTFLGKLTLLLKPSKRAWSTLFSRRSFTCKNASQITNLFRVQSLWNWWVSRRLGKLMLKTLLSNTGSSMVSIYHLMLRNSIRLSSKLLKIWIRRISSFWPIKLNLLLKESNFENGRTKTTKKWNL